MCSCLKQPKHKWFRQKVVEANQLFKPEIACSSFVQYRIAQQLNNRISWVILSVWNCFCLWSVRVYSREQQHWSLGRAHNLGYSSAFTSSIELYIRFWGDANRKPWWRTWFFTDQHCYNIDWTLTPTNQHFVTYMFTGLVSLHLNTESSVLSIPKVHDQEKWTCVLNKVSK